MDQDSAIESNQLQDALDTGSGSVSLLIRSEHGHKNRGGYYFHLRREVQALGLYDFEKNKISNLTDEEAILLINHCSGRKFDEASFYVCQRVLNFRTE